MLRQSRAWASRASPAQKSQGLRVVSFKIFQGLHFLFSGPLSYMNNMPVNKFEDKAQQIFLVD